MPSSCCGGEVHDLLLVASERVHHERGQAHGKQQAQRDARRLRVARQRDERRACDHTHMHMPMHMPMYMHMHVHMHMRRGCSRVCERLQPYVARGGVWKPIAIRGCW